MASWTPSAPFTVPMRVMETSTARVNGVLTKVRTPGRLFMANARTFGGTEVERDGQVVVEDTVRIETWFAPDIVSGSAIRMEEDGSLWEVMGSPEDILMRHQYLTFKARRAKGGA